MIEDISLVSDSLGLSLFKFQQELTSKLNSPNPSEGLLVPIASGDDTWLFPSSSVLKIDSSDKISCVPGCDPMIAGVVSLDGSIYTLLDFNIANGHSSVSIGLKSRVVFLDGGPCDSLIALLVERILPLTSLDGSSSVLGKENLDDYVLGKTGEKYRVANLNAFFSGDILSIRGNKSIIK